MNGAGAARWRRPPAVAPHAAKAAAAAAGYARAADSPHTRRGYAGDWRDFLEWCQAAGLPALPAAPETVGAYLAGMARTHALATLRRRLASIARAHRQSGRQFWRGHPAIRDTLRGIAREHGVAPRRAAALTTPEIRKLVAGCGGDAAGLRDRALILLGYAAALRRSELVALDRDHVEFDGEGVRLLVARGKGDAAGRGAAVGVPRGQRRETCPVRALEAWLEASGCRFGPVFRAVDRWGGIERGRRLHPDAVRTILLRRAAAAGLEGTAREPIAPHGLRAGFVTAAYAAGVRDEEIMAHTRHRDLRTMRGYVRRARLMADSPAKRLGL